MRSASKAQQIPKQIPRRKTHERTRKIISSRRFNYELDYKRLNLRRQPELYRVGVGEQGVLLVEPYKSEILPHWRFKDSKVAKRSSTAIYKLFKTYVREKDFIGMDMARKFLQMGYTRSRRYANHASGRKYDENGNVLPFVNDETKAQSARIFWEVWKKAEADPVYSAMKIEWKKKLG